ncbi:MAG: molybdopterin-dependent oxidoreductase [Gemmatimonadota bacterium]
MPRSLRALAYCGVLLVALVAVAEAQASLRVEASTGPARTYTRAALEAMSSDTMRAAGPHTTSATYRVVPLQRLLAESGLVLDSIRGRDLGQVVIAEARDGYQVVFSLGELAPSLGARTVFVAFRRDGIPIPAEDGPFRLVVPDDMRGSRSIRQLERLRVVTVAPRAP